MIGAWVGAELLMEQHVGVLRAARGCSTRAASQSLLTEVHEGKGRLWHFVWQQTGIHGSHKALWPGSRCLVEVLSMMSETAQCCVDS